MGNNYKQSIGFQSSSNVIISGLTSLNSQMYHVVINGCRNVNIKESEFQLTETVQTLTASTSSHPPPSPSSTQKSPPEMIVYPSVPELTASGSKTLLVALAMVSGISIY